MRKSDVAVWWRHRSLQVLLRYQATFRFIAQPVGKPCSLQEAADSLLLHKLQRFVAQLVPDLSQMMAPGVLVRQFKELHLQLSQSLVLILLDLLVHIIHVFGPRRTPHHRLDEDPDQLHDLGKIIKLRAGASPQPEKRMQPTHVQSGPLQNQRLEDFLKARPGFQR